MLRKIFKDRKPNNKPEQENEHNDQRINPNLDKTLAIFKQAYSYPENTDFTVRNLHIGGLNKRAALIFVSTTTDIDIINEFIIDPLLKNKEENNSIEDMITAQSVEFKNTVQDVILDINNGNAALLIEGESQAYSLNVSNFEGRGVEKPDNESVVKGPKEAFNEKVFTNISLIRKRIRNENLIVENSTISRRSNNKVYMLYIKDIANEKLLTQLSHREKSN